MPVTRITLVGHSMGGLVARAATNHATASGQTWQHLVRDVVCLGTPHAGANLEKVAHLGSRLLRFWPESAPFSSILESRSAGIVDLRHGYITKDEWEGRTSRAVGSRSHRRGTAAARGVPLRRRHARRLAAASAECRAR